MKLSLLGSTKLKVSAIGLGCMGMSEFYGAATEVDNIATLQLALQSGINFFDTADMYGNGANEELLAKAFASDWHKIILATKFGIVRDPHNPHKRNVNNTPQYVKKACDASLKRLKVNVIDLYYLHRHDLKVPIEEVIMAMADLVAEGKVRYLGLSEVNAKTLERAYKVHPITALQSEYSLWTRGPEKEILPLCQQLGISFVAYSPLGRGFLTNTIQATSDLATSDFRRHNPRFQAEAMAMNKTLVAGLAKMAQAKNITPAQLALAWVLAKPYPIIPIPGTKRQKYLLENIAAIDIHLTAAEVAALDTLFAPEKIAGLRYNAEGMKYIEQ